MKSMTQLRKVSWLGKNDRGRAWRRIFRLSVALALTVATVASAQSYKVLHSFGGSDGARPRASLVLAGNTLYGTTVFGGDSYSGYDSGNGVVFKVNTDGSGFAVLKSFTGSDGDTPYGGPVLVGSTLYGTTVSGGEYGWGEVFTMNTDGSGFAVLYSFSRLGADQPNGDLVLANGTLYGTTYGSIENGLGDGAFFKVNTDGSRFAVLKSFTGSDGDIPYGGLVLVGSTLYGTTVAGGEYGMGEVYKMNTDGSGFAVLKSFIGSDGDNPYGGLVLAGSTLYGTTAGGGGSGYGVVFKVNTNGSGFAVLKNFTGRDGEYPYGGLVLAGNRLYGTTTGGGNSDSGVVFSLTLLTITTPPATQTAEAGTTVGFQVGATSAAPGLAYQWFFNDTNVVVAATNAILELTNMQPAQAGSYSVVVTNMGLAMTSAPALLSVIPAVDRRVVPAVHLTGGTGSFLHLEYADSLAAPQWSSLSNLTLSGGPQFCFDFCQSPPAQRFYRAWQTNGPQPTLSATTATEIPLTGAIGSSVRVDYINQFGPTDAWVTLDTVQLTNTTQLYYDFTAFGQPTRLYRLVPLQ